MAPEISPELIRYLVEIGETERFGNGEQLFARFPLSRSGMFMRLSRHAWYEVASSLDAEQIVALIKTLTVFEQRLPNFCAGSVSPVIWLFSKLPKRSSEDRTSVIDWVLAHTENSYLPFGTHNFGAKSLDEFLALSARAVKNAAARSLAEKNRQLEAKARKATEATHKLFGALRRRDEKAVSALLSQGADIHAANEQGQTALEYAQSVGLHQLFTLSPNSAANTDAAR